MQRLNSQDALFVYGETRRWPLHMASLLLCEAVGSSGALDVATVRELYRARLPHIPAYRRKLARVPGGLDRPVWVEVTDLDVDEHIHGVTLDPPGSLEQLGDLVGRLHEPQLDLDRPPWQIWVIDGLEDGRVAVLSRVHHAVLDGIRGMEVQAATFDITSDAALARPGEVPGVGSDRPSGVMLLGGAAAHLAATPVRAARTARHLAGAAGRLLGVLRRKEVDGFTLPMTAPRTDFNRSITARRAFSFGSVPLAVVKRAARQEGVTVNDVVLALVGGALRRYLDTQGTLPERSLTAAVPVGLASADGSPTGTGNHWEAMVTSLASDVLDPIERIHAVARSSRAAKAVQSAIGDDLWTDLVDLPPALVRILAHGYAGLRLADLHPALVNVVISNVRGAPFPLYFAGTHLHANYPVGPIADGFGLNVTLISYQDSLDFGFASCPDLVEDPWGLVSALNDEVAALEAACPAPSGDS